MGQGFYHFAAAAPSAVVVGSGGCGGCGAHNDMGQGFYHFAVAAPSAVVVGSGGCGGCGFFKCHVFFYFIFE